MILLEASVPLGLWCGVIYGHSQDKSDPEEAGPYAENRNNAFPVLKGIVGAHDERRTTYIHGAFILISSFKPPSEWLPAAAQKEEM